MRFRKFYGHFAAAYGTIWLALLLVALITQDNIDAGSFGLFGFPIIAAIYAAFQMASDGASTGGREQDAELRELRRRLRRLEGAGESQERL